MQRKKRARLFAMLYIRQRAQNQLERNRALIDELAFDEDQATASDNFSSLLLEAAGVGIISRSVSSTVGTTITTIRCAREELQGSSTCEQTSQELEPRPSKISRGNNAMNDTASSQDRTHPTEEGGTHQAHSSTEIRQKTREVSHR